MSVEPEALAETIRTFNRFYTRKIGVLQEHLLDSPFSLAEARVLYEIAHREKATATELVRDLGIDAGYVSRIVSSLEKDGLLTRVTSRSDKRSSDLTLTRRGKKTFADLSKRSTSQAIELLANVSLRDRERLQGAFETIEQILGDRPVAAPASYMLRNHQPGDMGWVVHRHGALYAREYGWDERFEALVARITADFIDHYDVGKERCWIAEMDGKIVGSVFLVKKSTRIAKLRLLYVEPEARGLGIGSRLVQECDRFATQAGYRKITLWTQSNLTSARKIYETSGYRMTHKEPHCSFGHDLIAEIWEKDL